MKLFKLTNRNLKWILVVMIVFVTVFNQVQSQTVIYVSITGGTIKNGSSWSTAFDKTQLRTAINDADPNSEIWIAAGTYIPDANRNEAFSLKSNVEIYGGFDGSETARSQRDYKTNVTILSGDLYADDNNFANMTENSKQVVYGDLNVDNTAVIDGFVISGGSESAISLNKASPVIRNCEIMYNTGSPNGGGLYVVNSNAVIENCVIRNNKALGSGSGGGIYLKEASPIIYNCIISDNESEFGGGILSQDSEPVFTNNIIVNNTSRSRGGGIYIYYVSASSKKPKIINNTIYNNLSSDGGGLYINNCSPEIRNSILWSNKANNSGNQVYFKSNIDQTLFAYNIIDGGKEAFGLNYGVSYDNNYASNSNQNIDPLIQSPTTTDGVGGEGYTADWSLNACSPCIEAADPATLHDNPQVNSLGVGSTDVYGNTRVYSILDIGAVEFGAVALGMATVYVNHEATGSNDGTSWTDAYTDLQDALNNICTGEIWVAKGTYKPTNDNDMSISFKMKNLVAIYGGFAGTETNIDERDVSVNETILSGDYNIKNSIHVIYNDTESINTTAVLDGFSITNPIYAIMFYKTPDFGACIANENASPLIRNCTFYSSSALQGGAIYNDNSSAFIQNCTFKQNAAYTGGGAVYNNNSDVVISNCVFIENSTFQNGGAIFSNGASKYNVLNCTFVNNTAKLGGVFYINPTSNPVLTNCILWNNTAEQGHEIFIESGANPEFHYCNISGGKEAFDGAGSGTSYTFDYDNSFNIDKSIDFADAGNGDFRLTKRSQCVNAGKLDTDLSNFPINSSGIAKDLDGNNRIFDGTVDRIDIGAYEFKGDYAANIPPVSASFSVTLDEDDAVVFDVSGFSYSDAEGDTFFSMRITESVNAGTLFVDYNSSATSDDVVVMADTEIMYSDISKLKFVPAVNANGLSYTTFKYKLSDHRDFSADNYTVTINVLPVNDAPIAADDRFTWYEDTPLNVNTFESILKNDTDIENDKLIVDIINNVATDKGDLVIDINDGSFTFTPIKNFNGDVSFTYKANDKNALNNLSDEQTVKIVVLPVNDAPVANNDALNVNEDENLIINPQTKLLNNDTDVEGDALELNIVDNANHGIVTLQPDGTYKYTPLADFNGIDYFTYKANDNQSEFNLSEIATVSITVDPVNDAPVAYEDIYTVSEDTKLTISAKGVLSNDTDIDGDNLTVSLETTASHGTVSLLDDGSFTYQADANYFGDDYFTYSANDGKTQSNIVKASIVIDAINDAPTAKDILYQAFENKTLSITATKGIFSIASDIDGDHLTVNLINDATNGTLTLNTDGSFEYIPGVDFYGEDSFSYTVNDNILSSDEKIVTINVSPTIPTITKQPETKNGCIDGDILFTIEALSSAPISHQWYKDGNLIDGMIQAQLSITAIVEADAGEYACAVSNVGGTTYTETISLILKPITILADVHHVKCNSANTGSITVNATGGYGNFQYAINANAYAIDNLFTELTNADYIITVKDENNCIKSETVSINAPEKLIATLTAADAKCYGEYGELSLEIEGGISDYDVNLKRLDFKVVYDGTLSSGTHNIDDYVRSISAGVYEVVIIDANDCIVKSAATVAVPEKLIAEVVNIADEECSNLNSGSVTVGAMGGTEPYKYSINNQTMQESGLFFGLNIGSYKVLVEDANQCQAETTTEISAEIMQPEADFDYVFTREGIRFFNRSTVIDSCIWYYGDGNNSGWLGYEKRGAPSVWNPSYRYGELSTYNVKLVVINRCNIDTMTQTIFNAVAIDEVVNNEVEFNIYPNPGNGNITVNINNMKPVDTFTVRLLSVNGQLLKENEFAADGTNISFSYDISNISKGYYLFEIVSDSFSLKKKVVVND